LFVCSSVTGKATTAVASVATFATAMTKTVANLGLPALRIRFSIRGEVTGWSGRS
jgi:hypothetical protein